jgi:hypothetical protein
MSRLLVARARVVELVASVERSGRAPEKAGASAGAPQITLMCWFSRAVLLRILPSVTGLAVGKSRFFFWFLVALTLLPIAVLLVYCGLRFGRLSARDETDLHAVRLLVPRRMAGQHASAATSS